MRVCVCAEQGRLATGHFITGLLGSAQRTPSGVAKFRLVQYSIYKDRRQRQCERRQKVRTRGEGREGVRVKIALPVVPQALFTQNSYHALVVPVPAHIRVRFRLRFTRSPSFSHCLITRKDAAQECRTDFELDLNNYIIPVAGFLFRTHESLHRNGDSTISMQTARIHNVSLAH